MKTFLLAVVALFLVVGCNRAPAYVGEYRMHIPEEARAELERLDAQVAEYQRQMEADPDRSEIFSALIAQARSFPEMIEKSKVTLNADRTFVIELYIAGLQETNRLEGTIEEKDGKLLLRPTTENGNKLNETSDTQVQTAVYDPETEMLTVGEPAEDAMVFEKI